MEIKEPWLLAEEPRFAIAPNTPSERPGAKG